MNINKRGGYSSGTDMHILSAYAREYHDEIIEQIKILNPDIIIFCINKEDIISNLFGNQNITWKCIPYTKGRNIYLFRKKWQLNKKNISIYSLPHPAVRLSASNFQRLFLSIYND